MGCGGSEEKEEAVDCEGGVENEEAPEGWMKVASRLCAF